MISTGGIGNGTGPYKGDIVKKDMKLKKVKAKKTTNQGVINEVKSAIKHKEPMMIAIAKKGKK
jgi:hypothetical protein